MNINVEQLERELTAVVAAILNLTVDSGIYRGGIPETVENGVAVRITGQQAFTDIDTPTYSVQVLGKFDTREEAWEAMLSKLAPAFPLYGLETASFSFPYILPDGGVNAPFTHDEKGKLKQYASYNLRVAVLTRPASVVDANASNQ